jgi:hypothetical protein
MGAARGRMRPQTPAPPAPAAPRQTTSGAASTSAMLARQADMSIAAVREEVAAAKDTVVDMLVGHVMHVPVRP